MADKTVLHNLNSGMVLDRSVLVTLPTVELTQVIASIRGQGQKPLYVVDNATTFFQPITLTQLLAVGDKRYNIVNEALGGFFTDQQIAALTNYQQDEIKPAAVAGGDLVVNLGAQQAEPVNGLYPFVPVPEGWSVGQNMSLGQTKIKRKAKNAEGDGTLFFMSPAHFEKLWHFASRAWSGDPNAELKADFTTGVGVKSATVMDDRISIGGNYIRRYEIEQVAKYRGWALPQLQAA